MKKIIKSYANIFFLIFSPITLISSLWLKFVISIKTSRFSDKIFMNLGILPILDQYYQPLINPKKHLNKSLRENRNLPGINLNTQNQINLIKQFNYNDELTKFTIDKSKKLQFYYNNDSYMSGDAEYLYNFIRYFKPHKIIEIGSGYSTLIANHALIKNLEENPVVKISHICIEPFEQEWLSTLNIELIREKVEEVDLALFKTLKKNDILFIDSSHIIRPQGDILFEYLQILPILQEGVIVHIHDIFTPKDYLDKWILEDHLLWNEQYLLEAFLTSNKQYKILAALNYLSHEFNAEFCSKAPIFKQQEGREPGAFWIQKC
jgi:hypothetical protein